MLSPIKNTLADFSRLLFPHLCPGCGIDLFDRNTPICYRCLQELPLTNYFSMANNPVEKSFYGRLHLHAAGAAYHFTQDSLIQKLLAALKYKQNIAAGLLLGRMMGQQLKDAVRFSGVDAMIPMPLHPKKEKMRGYNQASIISKGIQMIWNKPLIEDAIIRSVFSSSQTKQDRLHRWENMQGIFLLKNAEKIGQKHLLLVDDVTTTGASLEALGSVLEPLEGVKLSVATAAFTV